ncbi:hypothetical protein GCM10025857_24630 [Alicyclobacillus contaminans]|nr:hypothetical protein GCM10025857_24630 [Alicyclobacillus contaminans]
MSGDRKLPQRVVRAQTAIVEAAARQVESILAKHQGLTREARQEIREVMDSHLGNLEYFVLVREDSYGEIHTNRLREGIYFKDPVGMKCAQVTETTAFFYPRNTGEQLIDVSTPVHLNGKKVYALRSGSILHGVSRHVKVGGTFACLQLAGLLGVLLDGRGWLAYVFAVCLLGAACVVIWDRLAFQRAYGTWIGFLRKIGQGDLKHQLRPKSRDEFGQMQFELNKMSLGVADILHQVGRSAQQVAAAAEELNTHAEETAHTTEQIALAMQHVSSGSEAQAAEIDVSTRAVQQMSGDIRRMAEHAQIVVNQSNTGSALAARGHERIHRAMEQMTAIHGSTVQLSQAVTALGQRSEEIGQIVDVVAHIAGRTNLLALNAAIESARAGKRAGDLRSLPTRCAVWPSNPRKRPAKSPRWCRPCRRTPTRWSGRWRRRRRRPPPASARCNRRGMRSRRFARR